MVTTGHKVSKQDEAIKKFAKFWKYTSQDGYYPFKRMFLGRENYEIPDWMVELIRACSVEDPKICTTSIDRFLFLLKIQDETKKGCSIMQI